MYDNVYVQFKDAKFSITGLTSYFWVAVLEIKKMFKIPDVFDYGMLANAYSETLIFRKYSNYYAIKALKLNRKYAFSYVLLSSNAIDSDKMEKGLYYAKKALEFGGENYYLAYPFLITSCLGLSKWDKLFKYGQMYFKIVNDEPAYLFWAIYINFALKEKSTFKLFKLYGKSCWKYKYLPAFGGLFVLLFLYICSRNFTEENICENALANRAYKLVLKISNKQLLKQKNAKWYFRRAESLYFLNKYKKSLEALDKAEQLQSNCTDMDYSYWRGLNYSQLSEPIKALKYFNESILLAPASHKYLSKALCLDKLGKYDEVITIYKYVIEQYGESCLSGLDLFNLANAYRNVKDFQKALTTIDKSLLKQKHSYIYQLKGAILEDMGKYDEAKECYQKAEDIENNEV